MADHRDMLTQLRTELANLETREFQLRDLITGLERLEGGGTSEPFDPKNPQVFRDMTYGDAAQAIITKHGPLATRDIAEVMLQGGAKTKARNFVATLYSLLYKDGRFHLVERKWNLKGKGRK